MSNWYNVYPGYCKKVLKLFVMWLDKQDLSSNRLTKDSADAV